MSLLPDARTVLLVEGESDRGALLTLAERRGLALSEAGVEIVSMAGITAVARHVHEAAARGIRVGGVYDAPEERFVRAALEGVGRPADDLAGAGFFRCDADLEDEFIRALGADGVLAVIDAEGERWSYETLRQMPAQRGWSRERLLHRFLGVRAGRKHRYGRLLADAVPLDRVPAPLGAALSWALDPRAPGGTG